MFFSIWFNWQTNARQHCRNARRGLESKATLTTSTSFVLLPFWQYSWRRVTICNDLLEFVKILFLQVMQLFTSLCAAQTSRYCFERFELVQITAKALWHISTWYFHNCHHTRAGFSPVQNPSYCQSWVKKVSLLLCAHQRSFWTFILNLDNKWPRILWQKRDVWSASGVNML